MARGGLRFLCWREAAAGALQAAALLCAVLLSGAASGRTTDDHRAGALCASCHSGIAVVWAGKHGNKGDSRTPLAREGCESCHGDASKHLENPAVNALPHEFGRMATAEKNRVCTACHQGRERLLWRGSAHEQAELACSNCHRQHVAHDRLRARQDRTEGCLACHVEQRAEIHRPSRHPVIEGKVICTDCHNPHGSAGPAMLVRDSVNDTCYRCHMEKRGPFVRNHQPVQENCALCHNAHGTTHPNLLRQRPPFLCQQCHEPTFHRGTVPGNVAGTGNSINRSVVLARGCVNCHTNVHGTNSPVDIPGERTFRR